MNTRALLTVTFAFLAAGGCSTSTPIGIENNAGAGGNTTGASGTSGQTTAQGPYVPSGAQVLNDQPFTNPPGVSGDWVGYLENYSLYFPGSDAIRLHFGVDAQGNNTLSVVQGTGTPPPPPTDPFQAWPAPAIDDQGNPGVGLDYPRMPIAGFAYTGHEVTWQGSRLKFQLISAEPWAPWCALQTSYLLPNVGAPDIWTCNAGNGVRSTGPGTCQFTDAPPGSRCTPNHQYMCSLERICGCNPTGCGASTSSAMFFDITFFGDHAAGSLDIYNLILMPATP